MIPAAVILLAGIGLLFWLRYTRRLNQPHACHCPWCSVPEEID